MEIPPNKTLDAYYGRLGPELQRKTRERIHWMCADVIGNRVLEFGGSQGLVPVLLAREGISVTGLSRREVLNEHAEDLLEAEDEAVQARVSLSVGGLFDLESENAIYDTIIVGDVFEHSVQPARLVRRAAELLAPNGRLLVTCPFGISTPLEHSNSNYLVESLKKLWPLFQIQDFKLFSGEVGFTCVKRPEAVVEDFDIWQWELVKDFELAVQARERSVSEQLSVAQDSLEFIQQDIARLNACVEQYESKLILKEKQLQEVRTERDTYLHRIEQEVLNWDSEKASLERLIAEAKAEEENLLKKLKAVQVENQRLKLQLKEILATAKWKFGEAIGYTRRNPKAVISLPNELWRIFRQHRRAVRAEKSRTGTSSKASGSILKKTSDLSQAWLSKEFHSDEDLLIREELGLEQSFALVDLPQWVEVPVNGAAQVLIALRLQGSLGREPSLKDAIVKVEYLDRNNKLVTGKQSLIPYSKSVGNYFYLPIKSGSFTVCGFDIPKGAKTLRLGIQKWASDSDCRIENRIGVCRLHTGVSVVIPTWRGSTTLLDCIKSLRAQTLAPELWQIVIVPNGDTSDLTDTLDKIRSNSFGPELTIVFEDEANLPKARNAGIKAANREFVTFVDDDDVISPGYLESLFKDTPPDTISVSQILDVVDGETQDNAINEQIRRSATSHIRDFRTVSRVLGLNAAKLLPAFYTKQSAFCSSLKSGEDVVFYADIFSRFSPKVRIAPLKSAAVYYRTMRENSVSRREMSMQFNVIERLDVVAALELLRSELVNPSQPITSFLSDRERSQAMFIVNYLKLCPNDHGEFVELAKTKLMDASQIIKWVNDELTERLVISYCFPPYVDPAGVVTAKRIQATGVPVDVISNDMGKVRDTDNRLNKILAELVSDSTELKAPVSFGNWKAIREFSERAWEIVEQRVELKGPYQSLYSRALWPASNFAAALVKMRNPETSWQAEFSDPILLDIHGQERPGDLERTWLVENGIVSAIAQLGFEVPDTENLFAWCELLPYLFADTLIFTNEHQLNYMMSYLGNSNLESYVRRKAVIMPQPTLSESFYTLGKPNYHLDEDCINIGYFGSFYPTRGLGDVLSALHSFPGVKRSKLRFHIFTNQADAVRENDWYSALAENIVLRDYVDYLDFLALTKSFDCLVVNDASTLGSKPVNPYLPSKVSDYLGSGTPIWGICEPGSCLDALADEGKIAYRSELGDLESQLRVLNALSESDKAREEVRGSKPPRLSVVR